MREESSVFLFIDAIGQGGKRMSGFFGNVKSRLAGEEPSERGMFLKTENR